MKTEYILGAVVLYWLLTKGDATCGCDVVPPPSTPTPSTARKAWITVITGSAPPDPEAQAQHTVKCPAGTSWSDGSCQ